jgi:hypothetical protein
MPRSGTGVLLDQRAFLSKTGPKVAKKSASALSLARTAGTVSSNSGSTESKARRRTGFPRISKAFVMHVK